MKIYKVKTEKGKIYHVHYDNCATPDSDLTPEEIIDIAVDTYPDLGRYDIREIHYPGRCGKGKWVTQY